MKIRTGIGFDVHKLVEGRKCIIGGVEIDHHLGLLGHSDADVLAHAIADAILGAAGLSDIGTFFKDTDPANKGMDSMDILKFVASKIREMGLEIGNIDSIVMCERPKINPHRQQMIEKMSRVLGIDPSQLGIKGTTTEKLGFTGREEGIAAQATVLLFGPQDYSY